MKKRSRRRSSRAASALSLLLVSRSFSAEHSAPTLAEKEKAITLLAEAINDVKRIEVDLDRTGNEVMVLTGRLDELNVQCAVCCCRFCLPSPASTRSSFT